MASLAQTEADAYLNAIETASGYVAADYGEPNAKKLNADLWDLALRDFRQAFDEWASNSKAGLDKDTNPGDSRTLMGEQRQIEILNDPLE